MMRTSVLIGLVSTGVVALSTVAVVETIRWEHKCQDAGGHTVAIWEGSHIEYTYDDKGQVTGFNVVQDYRYECHDEQGQELNP